jgi:hypothetical protein
MHTKASKVICWNFKKEERKVNKDDFKNKSFKKIEFDSL